MIYLNDEHFDKNYFDQCYQKFNQHDVLGNCQGKRITACISDAAVWIALCLYASEQGISVFPLPAGTPEEAIRRRAKLSGSHYQVIADSIEELLSNIEKISDHEDDAEPVLVQMSSGTTGEPKCIDRTWVSIDIELQNYIEHFTDLAEMTAVVACPVNHSYGLICGILASIKRGSEPVIITNFNPKYIINKVRETTLPILYSSPALITTITMMVKSDQPIYAIMTSGTLMQAAWLEQAANKCQKLYQQYGCSEVGCIALGGDIKSIHDQGVPLPHLTVKSGSSADELQEIVVTTEASTKNISTKNISTKETSITVSTRDLGYLDANNRLHFISRIDEMINVAGLNVYPAEVEEVVMDMPEIHDAVVFKKSHAFGSDQVCLQFVAEQKIASEDIRSWCSKYLNKYQVPLQITQVEKIDRLPNGKVSRKALAFA
jgi:acyl-coenzyme A synthetase/AMP-(fatty) acid ligase